jgi:plasmid stabilization system protein ParE
MIEISVHPEVELEYEAALGWYVSRSRKAAAGFVKEFHRALESIQQFPQANPLLDDRHRFASLKRFPFSLIYRVEKNKVVIVALAHSRRASGYCQGRF